MKKFIKIFSALFLISMAINPMQSMAKETVLRMSIPWPAMDPVAVQVQTFVDSFNKKANGKYIIELHSGEKLVKIQDSLNALKMGVVDLACWPISIFAGQDPIFNAAEVPFLADSVESDAARQSDMLAIYDQVLTKKFNCKPLFSFTCLPLDLISNKPVKAEADWKGLLTHSISPQSANFIKALGGISVSMPFPEGYQGIKKGAVNASMQSSSMMIMFKMNEVAKNVIQGSLIPASLIVGINMDTFNKMPKDLQELVVKTGKEFEKKVNDYFVKVSKENIKTLAKLGITVYNLPKKERDQWKKKLQPYSDSLLKAMGTDGVKVKKIAEEANAKYPYTF